MKASICLALKTDIAGGSDLSAENPSGRMVHFGVRERGA